MLKKMMIALAIMTAGVSVAATDASAGGHGFHGGGFHGHFHGGYFRPGFGLGWGPGFGYGFGYGYGYMPYASYLEDDEPACYRAIRRVHTRHGWRSRRVLVCS